MTYDIKSLNLKPRGHGADPNRLPYLATFEKEDISLEMRLISPGTYSNHVQLPGCYISTKKIDQEFLYQEAVDFCKKFGGRLPYGVEHGWLSRTTLKKEEGREWCADRFKVSTHSIQSCAGVMLDMKAHL